MSYYDVLCGVILRLPSNNGGDIFNNIDEINQKLGKAVETEFTDFMIVPFGMELVEPDMKVRILNSVQYPVEHEEGEDDKDIP